MSVFTLFGLFVGSFLNVCIDRLPKDQSVVYPPSHCANCQHKLGFFDLFPIFSYIGLRGKCRYCNIAIPGRIPIVETVTGLLFALLYWKLGSGIDLFIVLIYASLLIVMFFIDLEHQLILNKVTYPSMILALSFSFFRPDLGIWSALLGGAVGLAIVALIAFIYPSGMGWGDAKMSALVGVMVGFPLVFEAVLLWWVIGGVVATLLLIFKIKGRKDALPSGTFLAVAAMVTLLWGQAIYQWYLGKF